MCGIVGAVNLTTSGFFQSDDKAFDSMLLLNTQRGSHSTGIFGVSGRTKNVDIVKAIGNPFDLWSWKDTDIVTKRIVQQYCAVVGHGRYATMGKVTAQNAHPFVHGDITLVHNGTLKNFHALKNKYKLNFEVDSEAVCWMIANLGLEDTIKEIQGAYALVWYDCTEETMNFLRNSERPLEYMLNGKRMLFASEKYIIAPAVTLDSSRDWEAPTPFEIMHHYKLSLTRDKAISFEKTKLEENKQHFYYDTGGYHGGFRSSASNEVIHKNSQIRTAAVATDTVVCAGEDVEFYLDNYTELTESKSPEGVPIVFLKGRHVDNKTLEISSKFFGGVDKIRLAMDTPGDQLKFRGVVTAIHAVIKDKERPSFKIFLNTCELVPQTSLVIVPEVPPPRVSYSKDDKVHIGNYSMSSSLFTRLCNMGCGECNGKLDYKDVKDMGVVHSKDRKGVMLVCPKCNSISTKSGGSNEVTMH